MSYSCLSFVASTRAVVASTRARTGRARRASARVEASGDDAVKVIDRRAVLRGALSLAALDVLAPSRARAVNIGDKAPDFTLRGTKGASVHLGDVLKEQKFTVVYFYNQDGSPGCSVEAQRFEAAIPEFAKREARVLGISMDSLDKHEQFCADKGLKSFTLLSDGDGSVSESYGADLKIPIFGRFSDRQTFLVDGNGTIINHWLERDQSMASVKTTAHVEQILNAIDAA